MLYVAILLPALSSTKPPAGFVSQYELSTRSFTAHLLVIHPWYSMLDEIEIKCRTIGLENRTWANQASQKPGNSTEPLTLHSRISLFRNSRALKVVAPVTWSTMVRAISLRKHERNTDNRTWNPGSLVFPPMRPMLAQNISWRSSGKREIT